MANQIRNPKSEPQPTAKKKRVNFPASAAYPHRSTAPLHRKVLAVLGVLKVASTNQVWKLAVPHHKRSGKAYEALRDLVENSWWRSAARPAPGPVRCRVRPRQARRRRGDDLGADRPRPGGRGHRAAGPLEEGQPGP